LVEHEAMAAHHAALALLQQASALPPEGPALL
jgi:hypothetical protein